MYRTVLICDFCEESSDKDQRLVKGSTSAVICEECAKGCVEIFEESKDQPAKLEIVRD